MATNNTANERVDQIAIEDLYPALVQCFGTILCGYIAGRLKIITNADTKGLNTFVGTFALPSLIFTSLVTLDWKTVNWIFLLAILISKCIIFFAVGIVSLLMTKPTNFGRAGILAIFCTQSNDFAIGSPIVNALYHKAHPEYASYLYLMAPLSLAILNPIGYIFLELSSVKKPATPTQVESAETAQTALNQDGPKKVTLIKEALKSIILNPILFMTVFGVIGGFLLSSLPPVIAGVLDVFGKSFSATALFLLGLRMVDSTKYFCGPELLTPIILIIMKELALPLVIRQTINIIDPSSSLTETTDLSTFGFLYGTFPAAPGAFVIATKYDADVDLVASSMVACTFISGPIIFISAKMISLTNLQPSDFFPELEAFSFDISIIGILMGTATIILFTVTKRHQKMPHKVTCCLLISQIIVCIGVMIWSYFGMESIPVFYTQFILYTFGCLSSRIWCGISAISMLFIQYRSLCFVLKMVPIFMAVGWGIPAIIIGFLLIFDRENILPTTKRNPNFQYGNAQAAISLFILVITFIVTIGCLVLHQRYKRRVENYLSLTKELSTESVNTKDTYISNAERNTYINTDNSEQDTTRNRVRPAISSQGSCTSNVTVSDIEDLCKSNGNNNTIRPNELCDSSYACSGSSRQHCQELVRDYNQQQQLEFQEFYNSIQSLRHTVVLILLLCSMFVSIALSVWTLIMEGMSGIYIELSFLEAFLNFGQVMLVAACFITDTDEFWKIIGRYWRKLSQFNRNRNIPQMPMPGSSSPSASNDNKTKIICDQFIRHHLDNCKLAIGSDRFAHCQLYKEAFYGSTFVNWLITVGLATDRRSAINFANYLIDGDILHHINDVKKFYDRDIIYCFSV
ncbi:integral membrane protein GPR155 [Contarinia nasturtii]|uniref:integral membrane protein GPR155 n=1 Tax=Contarinia nasturtii TaxID=265458 RepID=UPI0012D4573D|nr:integral membrane protein GPR155 [Contarinia nasturtii]XP_031620930.1 integral membrane protein GPR155 [Contarinia nasturtii]